MAIDVSLGYERHILDLLPFEGMPTVRLKIIAPQALLGPRCCIEGETLLVPEKIACEWLHNRLARLAADGRLTDRAHAYLTALNSMQGTGNFAPQY
jgi:hypothetical protein